MDALAFPRFLTEEATVIRNRGDAVSVLLERGVRVVPANETWRPGTRVQVLLGREGKPLAVRAPINQS